MADIQIPGDEIEAAAANMERVLVLLDPATRPPALEEVMGGARDVLDAAWNFHDRWQDGRTQLRDEAGDIQKALKQVLEGFTSADQQTADSLKE